MSANFSKMRKHHLYEGFLPGAPRHDQLRLLSASIHLVLLVLILTWFSYSCLELTHFAHIHPRLMLAAKTLAVLVSVISPFVLMPWILGLGYGSLKHGQLKPRHLKLNTNLNLPLRKLYPMLYPLAKERLKDVLHGTVVKTPDTRPAAWQLVNAGDKHMSFELRYDHTTLGTKKSRLYRRVITLDIDLRAKGVGTELELTYGAKSPMDYQAILELIEQTNAKIAVMLNDQLAPAAA